MTLVGEGGSCFGVVRVVAVRGVGGRKRQTEIVRREHCMAQRLPAEKEQVRVALVADSTARMKVVCPLGALAAAAYDAVHRASH